MESGEKSEISDRLQPAAPAEPPPNNRRPAPHVRPPQDQETSPPPHVAGTGAAAAQSLTQRNQDPESEPAKDDLRCQVEAVFASKLRGADVLQRESYIELLQSIGSTLREANVFLKEYPKGSSIRVKDFLDLLFASPKEKQKLEDVRQRKTSLSIRSTLRLPLRFTLREKPSVLSDMVDKTFAGRIKKGAKYCYASYPGKFKYGFEALTSDFGEFSDQSVACVYFCTKEDGLGCHHPDPEDSKGRCYCRRIYGEGNDWNRDYETFGYLHWVGEPYDKEKVEKALKVADAMNAVLVRKDASEVEIAGARKEAKKRWEASGRVPAWGCFWFHVWFGHMDKAVQQGQRLRVVYYPGMVGQGEVTLKDLQDPNVPLWDPDPRKRGLGGSQKAEVAMINAMKERHGDPWDYEKLDVSDFLKDSFAPGQAVAAWDQHEWKRGVIQRVHKDDGLQWDVRCKETGQVFRTDRVRHETAAMQEFADKLGKKDFLEALIASLPDGQEVLTTVPRQEMLQNDIPAMTFDIQSSDVEALKKLCDAVLSGALEKKVTNTDAFGLRNMKVQIEKTEFVKAYKEVLMSSTKLTPHQEEKVRELDGPGDFHLSAAAGSGKTFVAIRKVLQTLSANEEGLVFFAAPSKSLCLHFLRWLLAMHGSDEAEQLGQEDVVKLFGRLRLMHSPYTSIMTASLKGTRIELAKDEGSTAIQFVLSVVDEAHDIFRPDVEQGVLREILVNSSKQRILLSDESQSAAMEQNYPEEIQFLRAYLSQVVRSTERVVLGAKSFQLLSEQLSNDASSLSCTGPPLKTFFFEPKEDMFSPPFQDYCHHTLSALLHVISSYPRLSLHHCVAILVPNTDFLTKFKPLLENVLRDKITYKDLRLIDFEESLSHVMSSGTVENSKEECIVLDSVSNAKGLEEIIVISVGMDARIGVQGGTCDLHTRSSLYQTITRAQLMAIIVNEFLLGGWLEHLIHCRLSTGSNREKFKFLECAGDATKVVKEIQEMKSQENHEKQKRPLQSAAAGKSEKTSEAAAVEEASAWDVSLHFSYVWDDPVCNGIREPSKEPTFDPLTKSGAEAFEMLQSVLTSEELPSSCPHPKNDGFLWHEADQNGPITWLCLHNGTCLRRRKCYPNDDDDRWLHDDGQKTKPLTQWTWWIEEGEFELVTTTFEAKLYRRAQAKREQFPDTDEVAVTPWTLRGQLRSGRDLSIAARQTQDPDLDPELEGLGMFQDLSEETLKDLGMNPENLWFWLADF